LSDDPFFISAFAAAFVDDASLAVNGEQVLAPPFIARSGKRGRARRIIAKYGLCGAVCLSDDSNFMIRAMRNYRKL
jgi:hypothetical protein